MRGSLIHSSVNQLLVTRSDGRGNHSPPQLLFGQFALLPHHAGEVELQVFRIRRQTFDNSIKIHVTLLTKLLCYVHYNSTQASSKSSRGLRGNSLAGSPYPILQRKFERTCVVGKNS